MGNVGIGTNSPQRPLKVYSPTIDYTTALMSGDNSSGLVLADTNGSTLIRTDTDGRMVLAVGGDASSHLATGVINAATILPNGNIGFGTTTPNSQLDFGFSLGEFKGGRFATGATNGTQPRNDVINILTSGPRAYGLGAHNSTLEVYSANIAGAQVAIGGRSDVGEFTEHMVVKGLTGNVGIGTITPTEKLELRQKDNVALEFNASNTFGIRNILRAYDDSGVAKFSIGSGIDPNAITMVNGTGNIGIGTTSPTSKLQVVGLPIHADNTAAGAAGLTNGAFYHNGDGILRVKF